MANLLADLAAALAAGGLEAPGAEWKTSETWAKECGFNRDYALKILRRGIKAGKIEARKFRVMSGGRPAPVPHYRVIP
ncbi:hypothetical protein UFOVP836_59 [uncultured Caudovirales phage]|uniref:Uncharacterized protein n=1 Tax=uncultured Caudovirales phage TaxID=2100421 RepID=A0A6J5P4R2_9CAUD|nr:hypothetical protein UFOVP836_59 [uncultured Caudovirales phage]